MKVAVLIPAYNAANSLTTLLERTLSSVPKENIIVVDDGSTDTTSSVCTSFNVTVVRHEKNRGKGAALLSGFDVVMQNKFDAFVTMDADLQHQPEDIRRFIVYHETTKCDIIIGSRLHDKKGMPFLRVISNTLTTLLVKLRTGATISDSQSGFRFIHRRVLEKVRLQSTGFEAETEFLIIAASNGFTFGSIPIDTIYNGEKSHMTHFQTTINFLRVLLRQY